MKLGGFVAEMESEIGLPPHVPLPIILLSATENGFQRRTAARSGKQSILG